MGYSMSPRKRKSYDTIWARVALGEIYTKEYFDKLKQSRPVCKGVT